MRMPDIFKEVRVLSQEGKLHKSLITRTRILFGISLVLACIVAYNIVAHGASLLIVVPLALGGLVLGMYVFARMSAVDWDEGKDLVQIARMDKLGFATLGLYILFEIVARTFLRDFFPLESTAYILSLVFGTLLGRAIGTVLEIHRVYRATHARE